MAQINCDFIEKLIPVFTTKIENYEIKNTFLLHLVSEARRKNPESDVSNVNAWHRWLTNEDESSIGFEAIIGEIVGACEFISSKFSKNSEEKLNFKSHNAWIAEYDENDYTQIHSHFPADFSCVYYIDVEEDSSPMIIEGRMVVKPENGLLVIFPGILDHEVPKTKGKRVVLALNVVKDYQTEEDEKNFTCS